MSEHIVTSYQTRRTPLGSESSTQELGQTNDDSQHYNRVNVHQRDMGDHTIDSTLTRVRYGTWEGAPACLVALKFRFICGNAHLTRFTNAKIILEFSARGDSVTAPSIVNYGPKRLFGRQTTASITWNYSGSFSLKASAGPLETGPELSASREKSFEKGYQEVVKSFEWGPSRAKTKNCVKYFLWENKLQEGGIPEELNLVAIVEYDGPFQAIVEVGSTFLFDLFAHPWTKDDPILFEPGVNHGIGSDTFSSTEFSHLTAQDWERLITTSIEPRPQWHARATEHDQLKSDIS